MPKVAALYALTFWGIDECNGKLDPHIMPKAHPRDSWKAGNASPEAVRKKRGKRAMKINFPDTETVSMS